jgi:molybdenum cofactor guanylyltransferase
MTSIVLAGGKSSRFGSRKAYGTIDNKNIIEWVIDHLIKISTEIIIVTAREGDFASLATKYRSLRIKVVSDIYPGTGPLGGIYTGLVALADQRAVVVGCDMPLLNITLLDYMVRISSMADIVVPRTVEGMQPLCAVYSKNCLAAIQSLLERNELKIDELFDLAEVRYVEEDEIDRFDPEHLSFFNINTQADLLEARRLAMGKRWQPQNLP